MIARLGRGRADPARSQATANGGKAVVASDPPEPSIDLIRRAQAGCRSALHDLIQSQQAYVYSVALSVVRDPSEAADASQEAFLRVLRMLPTYRGETKFTTWLFRVVTNVCLDGLRRRRGHQNPEFRLRHKPRRRDAPLRRVRRSGQIVARRDRPLALHPEHDSSFAVEAVNGMGGS